MAHECCGGTNKQAGRCCKELPSLEARPDKAQIAALGAPDLIRRLRRGVENFDRRIFELSDEQLDQAFLPDAGVGRWPVRVLVGHLADAELHNAARVRRAYAEENPMLAVWDENAYVDSNIYGLGGGASGAGSIGAFVAVIHTLRQWTAMWLTTLDEASWARKAMHPERGPLSVRDIVVINTWHLEHHAAFLNAKLEKFLGVAPEEPEAAEGGCGSGCGCKH